MITRILPATLAAAIFLALAACGGDDAVVAEPVAPPPATATETITESESETVTEETEPAETETEAETATETESVTETEPAEPDVLVIRVRNGEPVGDVQQITAKTGDRVRFNVEADAPEEVHLHGYDISKDVGPGKDARFSFKADFEGIFEIELELSGVEIATLTVEP